MGTRWKKGSCTYPKILKQEYVSWNHDLESVKSILMPLSYITKLKLFYSVLGTVP
jgi:hypothetical protein